MKRTLLEMVQSIMNDMDADEVTSILDTFESEQVASIIRDTYFVLIDSRNWPHLKQFVTMTETDANTPTHITVPDEVKELIDLRYDMAKNGETRRKYKKLVYQYPDKFLDHTNQRNNDNDNIQLVTDPSGAELLIRNDVRPQYWTSFDDQTIVTDAFDSDVDTFLQASKTQCYAYVTPVWTHEDAFIPDLPEEAFTGLVEESKSMAFYTLKQMPHEKAEVRAQKADTWLSRKAFVTQGGVRYSNFGRRRRYNTNAHKPHPLEKND